MIIQPKPTIYKGITFRSRLEARWAMLLDNHSLIQHWSYEPVTVTNARGWTYTPDFLINTYRRLPSTNGRLNLSRNIYLEVKPNRPSKAYEQSSATFVHVLKYDLAIVYGNFYDIPFHSSIVSCPDDQLNEEFNRLLFADQEAIQLATTFRFDLKSTRRRR